MAALWTLGVLRGSAAVCVDPGRLPSSLGLWTESTNSAKGSFERAKENTYPCQEGKRAEGRLEGWLMGVEGRGQGEREMWVNQEEEGSREKV